MFTYGGCKSLSRPCHPEEPMLECKWYLIHAWSINSWDRNQLNPMHCPSMSSVICPGALAKPAHLSFPGPLVYHRDHRFVIFCQCPTNHLSPKHCLPKGSKGILKYSETLNTSIGPSGCRRLVFSFKTGNHFGCLRPRTCSWGSKRLSKLCLTDATNDFNPGCALQWNGSYNSAKNNGSTIYTAMVHIFGYYIYIYIYIWNMRLSYTSKLS